MGNNNIGSNNSLYTIAEAIAHTDKTIEKAGNRLQQKIQSYSLSHTRHEDNLISRT